MDNITLINRLTPLIDRIVKIKVSNNEYICPFFFYHDDIPENCQSCLDKREYQKEGNRRKCLLNLIEQLITGN